MKIVGIDPGYAIVGYGVIEYNRSRFTTLDYGAVVTHAGQEYEQRLLTIYNDLCDLFIIHKPDAVAIERLFFTTNQKTAMAVAQARGVIMLAATINNIKIYEYTPLQVKQSVVGYGKAEKNQVQEMTKRLLNLKAVPKPDDTADALAVAICHAHAAGSLISQHMLK